MDIHELSLIERNPTTQEIDFKSTLQAFTKELLLLKDQEKKIRSNRRYKSAIRKVFTETQINRIPTPYLVQMAAMKLKIKPEQYGKTTNELELHIRYNRGGYLRTLPGKTGGVELTKP
jgi:hypothetical protein